MVRQAVEAFGDGNAGAALVRASLGLSDQYSSFAVYGPIF